MTTNRPYGMFHYGEIIAPTVRYVNGIIKNKKVYQSVNRNKRLMMN